MDTAIVISPMECFASNITIMSHCQFHDDISKIIGVYENNGLTNSGRSSFKKPSDDFTMEFDFNQKVEFKRTH